MSEDRDPTIIVLVAMIVFLVATTGFVIGYLTGKNDEPCLPVPPMGVGFDYQDGRWVFPDGVTIYAYADAEDDTCLTSTGSAMPTRPAYGVSGSAEVTP